MTTGVEIGPPDIDAYAEGNTGIAYATRFESGVPGPDVVITALVHGNELCGAHALVRLFEAGIRPARGQLTLVFVNVRAFSKFDPAQPKATRFLDEDLNRVWVAERLDGDEHSIELDRAREIRPLIEQADTLLDLHSMQHRCRPLILSGTTERGRGLARAMGYPGVIVADAGHKIGQRMRDFGGFGEPSGTKTAILVECGQHWETASIDVAIGTCRAFLEAVGTVAPEHLARLGPRPDPGPPLEVEVTHVVSVERGPFRFSETFTGLEVIEQAGTVIAHDGDQAVRTPYDRCVLVMPSQRLAPGLTAVRLGRIIART